MTDDDAYIARLKLRLAELDAEIAELKAHVARVEEYRALDARARYILHKLSAPNAYHGPAWACRLNRTTSAVIAAE